MIRSVGVGGSSVNNQAPRRPQQVPQNPFPDISGLGSERKPAVKPEHPTMAGAKIAPHLKSIFDEEDGVRRFNADGDRLEVSKKAIKLAKENW